MQHGTRTDEFLHDQTKSEPETVPVEERNLPAWDVAMPEVQNDQQAEDVPEVRREE